VEQFVTARAEWLRDARDAFERDARVDAALLAGSLGRGQGDEWSDVDLVVAVTPDVIEHRAAFVTAFGDAVFVFDSQWNSPLDGAQCNVLYDVGCDWLLYVDWDLWPRHRAVVTPDVDVVFNRVGLPETDLLLDEHRTWPRHPRPEMTPAHLRRARLAMLPIIAKCIARGDTERAQRMLTNLGFAPSATDRSALVIAASAMLAAASGTDDVRLVRSIGAMLRIAASVGD
jgi:predicted nucleotidyltransferase